MWRHVTMKAFTTEKWAPKISFETWISVNPFVFKMRISFIFIFVSSKYPKENFKPFYVQKTSPNLWWVCVKDGRAQIIGITLPETNSQSTCKWAIPKRKFISNHWFSGALAVGFRETSFGLKSSATEKHFTPPNSEYGWQLALNLLGFCSKTAQVFPERWQEMRKVYTYIHVFDMNLEILFCGKSMGIFRVIYIYNYMIFGV